ncbi:MAG: ABC transporter substrate-binding protein [Thermomicrobiales bacterium]
MVATLLTGQLLIGVAAATTAIGGSSATSFRGLNQDGTPAAGEPLVITAQPEPLDANPSGDQVLRLAGPVVGPETLDPARSRDLASAFLIRQIFRGLTRFDAELQPIPELAEQIEISADGLEYTFTLREGITFHDGSLIESPDIEESLTRALRPTTVGGGATELGGPTFLSDIDGAAEVVSGATTTLRGIESVDERTVHIRLSAPRSTFLMKLASAPASIVDTAQIAIEADWWRMPNGSGPFVVAAWDDDEQLTLEPFEHFHSGTPPLKRIDILLGANAQQSFNLYQAGEIDLDSVGINVLDRVMAPESELRHEVTVTPLFAADYIAFRTGVEPMDDPMVRRAVQLGFPREKVARVTYEGYVEPAAGIVPHGMLGKDWPVDGLPYDLEAAREAIAQSRYGSADNVPPIRIYSSSGSGAESLRDVLRRDLGLTVEVIAIDWAEFMDGLSARQYPAYELYWGADYPDPESFLWTLFGTGRADNYIDYSNPTFDDLLEQAAAQRDAEARSALYARAQQVLMDDVMLIPLYYDVSYTVVKPHVKNLAVTSLGILRLETVWVER